MIGPASRSTGRTILLENTLENTPRCCSFSELACWFRTGSGDTVIAASSPADLRQPPGTATVIRHSTVRGGPGGHSPRRPGCPRAALRVCFSHPRVFMPSRLYSLTLKMWPGRKLVSENNQGLPGKPMLPASASPAPQRPAPQRPAPSCSARLVCPGRPSTTSSRCLHHIFPFFPS